MKEKNIFLMGLGTGLVITSIISLFSYNILKPNNIYSNQSISSTTIVTTVSDTTTEETSSVQSIQTTTVTTTKLELSSKPNLEITTYKPFEITSN